MDAKKREIRTLECTLSVREREGAEKGESRTITGTAIVFNSESQVLDDWGERFREVILPEAATMDFLKTQDIKMNLLHNRDLTVARWNKGKGSLKISVDERGVNFEFDAPKCDIGDRCLEMVRRGDYSGCSFEFWPKDYDVTNIVNDDGTTDVTITHKSFEAIGALTIGLDPAYLETAVNVRELIHREDKDEDEKVEETEEDKTTEESVEVTKDDVKEEPTEKQPEEDATDTDEEDDKEEKERENIAVMKMRRAKVSLMDSNDFIL